MLSIRALAVVMAIGLGPGGMGAKAQSSPPSPSIPRLVAGPPVKHLALSRKQARTALGAFALSCPDLIRRKPRPPMPVADWRPACAAAAATPPGKARAFFARWFETARLGDGAAHATGYFEPVIRASLKRKGHYRTPIYRLPSSTIMPRDANGRLPERAAIQNGALAGRGLELAWAADPIDLFFLEIQGSGQLKLTGGRKMRIGYAGRNGYPYVGIGALMRRQGLITASETHMDGIRNWLRANPDRAPAVMAQNPSAIFFREVEGKGPVGALGRPLTPAASVAGDPAFISLGAPVWLDFPKGRGNGLWIVQDTGGAIKGPNRFDLFWGTGPKAGRIAGDFNERGQALILLPRGTLAADFATRPR